MPHKAHRTVSATVSRRSLMIGTGLGLAIAPARPSAPEPVSEMSVTEVLRQRRSARAFADRPVGPARLAELRRAAFGINRPATGLLPHPHGAGRRTQ